MISFEYTIKNINNIHARPLTELAEIVKQSKCDIMIEKDSLIKDLTKIISMIQLKLKISDKVEISIIGDNEELEKSAYQKVEKFFNDNF